MTVYCFGVGAGVDTSVFDDCILTGDRGGKPFDFELLDEGFILKEIKAWVTEDVLHGIEVTLTDDSSRKFGLAEEIYPKKTEKGEFLFMNYEKITSLIVESDEKSKPKEKKGSLRGIRIETSEGRTWSVGSKHEKKKIRKAKYPVGSGICCGVFGFADDTMLYQLGFAMLQSVKEAIVTDFRMKENNNYKKVPEIIESFTHTNTSSVDQQAKFKTTLTVTTATSYGYTWTLGRVLEAKVGAKVRAKVIPGNKSFFESGGTTQYSKSESTTTKKEITSTETETKEFEWPVNVPPKKKVTAIARIYKCQLDTEYEADVEVWLLNGKVVKYKEIGSFHEITKREGWIETKEEDLK